MLVDDLEGLQRSGIDFVVLHGRLPTEIGVPFESPSFDMEPVEREYRARFGLPVFSDGRVDAFAISDRARGLALND